MSDRLESKRALVTGGSRGIGEAIVRQFVAEGASVVVSDIRDEEGQALAMELGDRATYLHLDVTDDDAWRRIGSDATAEPFDILVNNAGAVMSFAPLHEVEPSVFRQILELNLTSVFLGMRYVIPSMVANGSGSVINLSSISGVVGHDVAPAYQAAKGGVRTLTKNAAITYATTGVRVNSIHPGIIATPMVSEQPEWATEGFIANTPMGRAGEPDDVAAIAVFLAGDESSFVTGSEMYVDGGFVAQ